MEKIISKINVKDTTLLTGTWITMWVMVFTIHDAFLKPNGHNYLDSPLLVFSFFAGCGLLASKMFKTLEHTKEELQNGTNLLIILAIFLAYIGLTGATQALFPIGVERLEWFASMKLFSANFFPRASFSKSGDIFFQQVMIFTLIQRFRHMSFSERDTIFLFAIAFFMVHLPIFFFLSWVGLLFIVPSLAAGFLFSYLIVKFKRGFLYSLGLHLGFYYVLGLGLRYFVEVPQAS